MSFINPIFLFAIGAAVLPVLYHFVRKLKAKKVPFSSLMFLKATPKELIKKRRLRDILLMMIRAAIFGLLALAFARPFIPQERIPFIPQQQERSVVLLIDNSYSMQHGDLFDEARQAALDRIEAAGSDDEFAVVAFADGVQQLTSLSTDHALHRNVLQNTLAVSNRPTDFYQPLRQAEEILQEAQHEDRAVVLISDFQSAGWTGALENWKLDPEVEFVPVKVGSEGAENDYVQAFNLTKRRAGRETVLRFDARVASQNDDAQRDNTARLIIDGAQMEERDLSVLSSRRVSFQQTASRDGVFQGQLALDSDDLPVDDQFYFTYTVEARPSILAVGDRSGQRSALFFLERVFDIGEAALYQFDAGGRQRLSAPGLRSQQVVLLANVERLTGPQLSALKAYVERGGGLIISFGERVDLDAFSDHLSELGVGRIEQEVHARSVQSTEAIIGDVDLRHPIFEVFAASGMGTILRPQFRRYVKVAPDSGAVVVGRYDTEDPFLVERRLGQGKVLVYTSTLNASWTDFPIRETYVPFVYQLVKHARRTSDARHLFTVGDVVVLDGQPGEEWDVRAPGDNVFKVPIDESGAGFFRETEVPGHYAASNGTASFFFSVNVDTRESDLQARDEEEVYAAVASPDEERATTPEQAATLVVEDEEQQQKLWRYVLLLVVALFALETVLANRRVGGRKGMGV